MKMVLGDSKTFRDGLLHYLLAGVLFSALLGGSVECVIFFMLRHESLFVFQGISGMMLEGVITWCAVSLSTRVMRRRREYDYLGIALISTLFSIMVSLASLPFIDFFSIISRASAFYLVLKEAMHICIFYTATIILFSNSTAKKLLTEARSQSV